MPPSKQKENDMKRALLSVLAISAATSAFAASGSSHLLPNTDKQEIRRLVPGADLENLTSAQAGALAAILHGNDNNSETAAQVRAILN